MTREQLVSVLNYDPETGVFTWKERRGGAAVPGAIAGHINERGYRTISLWNRAYYAHRLAWLYVHNELPTDYIDHINQDKDDNRISNLRVADHSMNKFNSKIYAGSKSGHNGVVFCKTTQKWRAQIKRNGKHYRGGLHETLESAVAERKELETKVFPDFHKLEDKP